MKRRYLGVVTVAQGQFSWLCSVAVGGGSIGLFFPCVVIDRGARWTIHKTNYGSIVGIRATC